MCACVYCAMSYNCYPPPVR